MPESVLQLFQWIDLSQGESGDQVLESVAREYGWPDYVSPAPQAA